MLTTSDTDSYTVTFEYDSLDRLTKKTYPDGTFEEAAYSRLDREKTRDRTGRWTYLMFDALGREVSMRASSGEATTASWCTACGSIDKLTDANGNTTSWERDVQGRVTREIRANGSDIDFVYENTTGRLKQMTDAKGQTRTYSYTLDNKVSQIAYTNAEHATANVTVAYDAIYGRRSSMTDGIGTTAYSYHPVGSLGAGQLSAIDGPLSSDTVAYTYDELGRLKKREINGSANEQAYVYDSLGRIESDSDVLGSYGYTYHGATNRRATVTYPNGQTTTYDYFANSGDRRLQDIHHKLSGGATLSRFQYTYDVAGNIVTWSQQRNGSAAQVLTYGHDASDQLVTASRSPVDATLVDRFAYAYDRAGNRTAEQLDDAVIGATYNNMNRLTSTQPGGMLRFAGSVNETATVTVGGNPANVSTGNVFAGGAPVPSGTSTVSVVATDPSGNVRTNNYEVSQSGSTKSYTYDANGNMTGDGTRTYEWDAHDRLISITSGTQRNEISYDGSHRWTRVVEKNSGVVVTDRRYVWSGPYLCEERDTSTGAVTRRFLLHGTQVSGTGYFYVRDHLDSVTDVADSSNAVRARYDYDPFGRRTKLSGDIDVPDAFTGHITDRFGLLHAWRRSYDPPLGRWLSEDPLQLSTGPNRYLYVYNAPLTWIDPDGQAGLKTDQKVDCLLMVFSITKALGKTNGWGYAHCMANCLIVKYCGSPPLAKSSSLVKELMDVGTCALRRTYGSCESGWQDQDWKDNDHGRRCPRGTDCFTWCDGTQDNKRRPPAPGPLMWWSTGTEGGSGDTDSGSGGASGGSGAPPTPAPTPNPCPRMGCGIR